jgi:hypothetical protein
MLDIFRGVLAMVDHVWRFQIRAISPLQIAGITALTKGLLALPIDSGLLTPAQREKYAAFAAILPPLPLTANGTQYAPAEVVSSGTHNSEVSV